MPAERKANWSSEMSVTGCSRSSMQCVHAPTNSPCTDSPVTSPPARMSVRLTGCWFNGVGQGAKNSPHIRYARVYGYMPNTNRIYCKGLSTSACPNVCMCFLTRRFHPLNMNRLYHIQTRSMLKRYSRSVPMSTQWENVDKIRTGMEQTAGML